MSRTSTKWKENKKRQVEQTGVRHYDRRLRHYEQYGESEI